MCGRRRTSGESSGPYNKFTLFISSLPAGRDEEEEPRRREYLYTIFLAEGGRGRNFPARSDRVSINKPPENGFVTHHHLARTKLACGAAGRCWERN